MTYDSRQDTLAHIAEVRARLDAIREALWSRGDVHDDSKLCSPEKPIFDEVTPKLRGLTYGSPEYREQLAHMGTALDHHYRENRHHPEHFSDGIRGMTLIDLLEMLADWKAATMRHTDGSLAKSFEVNRERFRMSDELHALLVRTAVDLGWMT
jgi:hypothetical protein